MTAGIGYDKITSGWYLLRVDTLAVEEDSLSALKRTYEALDDPRIKTRISWTAAGSERVIFSADNVNYLSKNDMRNNLVLSLKTGAVTLENDLQIRSLWDKDGTSRAGYMTDEITGRLKPEISDGFFFVLKNTYELVRYDGGGEYDFDYNYNTLSVGFEKEFGWTNLIALTYRNDTRVVSDSSRLNYVRHRAIFELNWSPTFELSFDLENELTRIESNKGDGLDLDDGWEELVEAEINLYIGVSWKAGFRELFEYVTYDAQDVITFDYTYSTTELSLTRRIASWFELFVRPSVLLFQSRFVEYEQQDYRQFAVEYGSDISESDRIWITASHKIGRRDYIYSTDEYFTDYMLSQLSLFGDLRIYGGLHLNAILSIDWEYHDLDENDNSLSLLSVGIDYRFR